MKRHLLRMLPVLLLFLCVCSFAAAETLQPCHVVTSTSRLTKQDNKSEVRLWHVETAHPAVADEINGLAEVWAAELAPGLPAAKNSGKNNSRLDVEIRYSRTGLKWMSFLVQARTVYHRKLTAQRIVSRTYDMTTGERVTLADVFDEEAFWPWLSERVREALTEYWPNEKRPV